MLLKCRIGLGGWKAKLVVRFALTVTFNDKWQSLLFDIFIKSPKLFILVLNWIFKWCGWDFSFHLPSMTLSSSSLCLLFSFFFYFTHSPAKLFSSVISFGYFVNASFSSTQSLRFCINEIPLPSYSNHVRWWSFIPVIHYIPPPRFRIEMMV